MPPHAAAPAPAKPASIRVTALSIVLAVALAGSLGAFAWSRWGPGAVPVEPGALPGDRAEIVARALGVAFENSQASWQDAPGGGSYAPAGIRYFSGTATSPCTGTALASGPFYCRLSREAAFDLAFLNELGLRLRREAELGWALVAGRLAAAHAQGELGVTDRAEAARQGAGRRERAAIGLAAELQADCLTGVWAEGAGLEVRPRFYYELVRIVRNVANDRAALAPAMPPGLDPFRPGGLAEREAAFRTGLLTGDAETCPAAYPVAAG